MTDVDAGATEGTDETEAEGVIVETGAATATAGVVAVVVATGVGVGVETVGVITSGIIRVNELPGGVRPVKVGANTLEVMKKAVLGYSERQKATKQ